MIGVFGSVVLYENIDSILVQKGQFGTRML